MDNETEVILEQMEGTRSSLAAKVEKLENQVVGTIQEATTTVAETVQQVKEAVTDTVEAVKGTVEGTVETVKDTVQGTVESVKETFDLRRQVENHPWLMFGGSFAVGFLTSRFLGGSMRPDVLAGVWHSAAALGRASASPQEPQSWQGGTGQAYDEFAGERGTQPVSRPEPAPQKPGWLDSLAEALGPELGKLKGLAIGTALGVVRDMVTQSAPPEVGTQLAEMVNGVTTRLGGEVIHGPVLEKFLGDRESQEHDRGPHHEEVGASAQYACRTGSH